MSDNYDYLFKMLLIGDSGVGKTCLLLKYADQVFIESYITTIGVDFRIKTETFGARVIKVQIWDTAGQERFRTITSSYYRGAHAAGIVFDLTDMDSFQNIPYWLQEIKTYASPDIYLLLVGTKADMITKRVVTQDLIDAVISRYNMKYVETSAKSDIGVNTTFRQICMDLMTSIEINKQKNRDLEDDILKRINATELVPSRCC